MLALAAASALAITSLRDLAGADPAAFDAWLRRRVQTADRAFGAAPCPEANIEVIGARALGPDEKAGPPADRRSARPVRLIRVRLTGCARSIAHNLQVTRTGVRSWEAVAVLPGASKATPRTQMDLMQALATVALNGAPRLPCSPTEALRTWANGEVEMVSDHQGGAWRERWPMRMCGQDRTVEVEFSAGRAERRAAIIPAWR